MPVQKRGDRWHYAFCIRGVRYRGAIPEARTKFEAEKAETKISQEVYEGRYGRPTGEKDFGRFVGEVYKPWARENKRSFENNEKYKLPMICESKSLKGKTFAQISPLLIEKYKKERRELPLKDGTTRRPSTSIESCRYSPRSSRSRSRTGSLRTIRAPKFRCYQRTTNVCATCWTKKSINSYQS